MALRGPGGSSGGGGGGTFSVASFTDNQSSPVLMGSSGVWEAAGAISFSASYTNGPATSGVVSMSGAANTWSPNSLTMGGTGFVGPTVTTQNVNYPSSVDGTITFSLSAGSALGGATATRSHVFNNLVYWGTSTKNTGYLAADITGLSGNGLQGAIAKIFTVTAAASNYIVYAYPARYGTAIFSVNGFTGGFLGPDTVSITNASGFTETYNIYHSTNSGLGATTVTAAAG